MKTLTLTVIMSLLLGGAVFAVAPHAMAQNDASTITPEFMLEEPVEDATAVAPHTSQAYVLQTGDTIRLSVFGFEELTGEYKINSVGRITVPLIGEVEAAGYQKNDLEILVSNALINGSYFNDPNVTIEIIGFQPFYILGEVSKPGSYEFTDGLDVFKAIATAGGYSPRAKKGMVYIYRTVNGEKIKIRAREGDAILPGDSIKVRQRLF